MGVFGSNYNYGASNPYKDDGATPIRDTELPFFRNANSYLLLGDGVIAPSFPVQSGTIYHSYPTEKPERIITERYFGTTRIQWTTEGIQKDDRDYIYNYWNTVLLDGFCDFTVIDHNKRFLFEASWGDWIENWDKRNGGVWNIPYNIESPVPWTPRAHACYPMYNKTLKNHNISGDDLTLADGELINIQEDSNVNRNNGYALKLTGDGATSQLTGASGTVSWDSHDTYNSLSLFCQIRLPVPTSGGGRIDLFGVRRLTSVNGYMLSAEYQDASTVTVYGYIFGNGQTVRIDKSVSTTFNITQNTWYDLGMTYDSLTGSNYIYIKETDTSSFTNFNNGASQDEQIGSYMTGLKTAPDKVTWDECFMLSESTATGFVNATDAYLQNAFVFFDHMPSATFNTIRRICYMWNQKTDNYPK